MYSSETEQTEKIELSALIWSERNKPRRQRKDVSLSILYSVQRIEQRNISTDVHPPNVAVYVCIYASIQFEYCSN